MSQLPTAEWVAEMAARVYSVPPESRSLRHGDLDVGWLDAAEKALDAYKAAKRALARARGNELLKAETNATVRQLLPHIPKDEVEADTVEYFRACKLITGETRKDRAEDRFNKLLTWLYSEYYWYEPDLEGSEVPPNYREQGYLRLREIAQLKIQQERMKKVPKKELAQALGQFGHKTPPKGGKTA